MKKRTLRQVETAKCRAERFVRDVLDDDERADEIAAESAAGYAARKRLVLSNPTSRKGINMATKQELERELDEAYSRIDELETHIAQGADLLQDEDDDEDEDDDADSENTTIKSRGRG
jgi:prephenate dehydrogenase